MYKYIESTRTFEDRAKYGPVLKALVLMDYAQRPLIGIDTNLPESILLI